MSQNDYSAGTRDRTGVHKNRQGFRDAALRERGNRVRVETYSNNQDEEIPISFWFGNKRFEIMDIEDRWYSQGLLYYKVFTDDARHYILKKNTILNEWYAQSV